MKYLNILNDIEEVLNNDDYSSLSYSSLVEEALKISIKAKNSDCPLIIVKENNYLVNKLKDILLSYFDESEIIAYLPEESLRAEEIASSYENRASRVNALYRLVHEDSYKLILCSPYGLIRHLPNKQELKDNIIKIKKDDTLDKQELIDRLIKLG